MSSTIDFKVYVTHQKQRYIEFFSEVCRYNAFLFMRESAFEDMSVDMYRM